MTNPSTPFAPGTPCWVDLFTSDPERSGAFYAAVLGWELTDLGEELGGYTLARSGGEVVAGLMRNSGDSGSPDTWSTYLATDDVEATVARAVEAGATVLAPPMPLGRLGSTAVVVDPAGAVVGLWQGDEHRGFTRHGEPGSVVWSEVHSKSFGASRDFYATVFGWRYEVTGDSDDFRYLTAKVDGTEVAGVMDSARFLPDAVPSHWAVYLGVEDADAAERTAVEHGATVLMSAQDTPFGRIADLLDPTGAPFKLHASTLKNPPPAE
ncbi:VOC family protein [Microlunatus spumicola]|uniref:VOC family protein n=1 Tax=Microlunatus spumicola TaxID=81499 RepID=A0ABP6XC12_9ACTN